MQPRTSGSPRAPRPRATLTPAQTAERLRDAADAEGYDFDAYGDTPAHLYSGRGMFGAEVPALVLADYREAVVVAARAERVLGVPVRVDSLGRSFVVYPLRLPPRA